MANTMTRPLSTGGPYGHVPGAAPPLHARQVDPAEEAYDDGVSRLDGQDDTLNPGGQVGYGDGQGAAGYQGRDITDPSSWNGRPYNEAPGMFARLQQEAQAGG